MPSAQIIDLNPRKSTEITPLEKTLSAFSQRHTENKRQQEESDALTDIYRQYQEDGQNLGKTIMDVQTRPGISPTTRVNTVNQLLQFQKHNADIQKQAADRLVNIEKNRISAEKNQNEKEKTQAYVENTKQKTLLEAEKGTSNINAIKERGANEKAKAEAGIEALKARIIAQEKKSEADLAAIKEKSAAEKQKIEAQIKVSNNRIDIEKEKLKVLQENAKNKTGLDRDRLNAQIDESKNKIAFEREKLGVSEKNLNEKNKIERDKLQFKENEITEKKAGNQSILQGLEQIRGKEAGELKAFESNPQLAELVTRPEKAPRQLESGQPIEPDQLQRIQHVRNRDDFESASPSKKYQMLTDSGVSVRNAKAEVEFYQEEAKLPQARKEVIVKKQAEEDFKFANEQTSSIPMLQKQQQVLDEASKLNDEDATGNNWDILMQKAGLVQYTSEGYREFSSYSKEAVKNSNIKAIVGSQISQMEFNFFRDATINPNFSKEANNRIIQKEKAAIRYNKLYADITSQIIKDNNGMIPERIQEKVNEEFSKQSQKISREVKRAADEFQAIQNVPKGFTLMYDENRRPLHVPNDQVAQAVKDGASSK